MKDYINSNWVKWEDRNSLGGIKFPGIYSIAVSNHNLNGKEFSLVREIEYIGMTNSSGGLKSRLSQFNNTIRRKRKQHGGAHRFLGKYWNYEDVREKLFVSICSFECGLDKNNPDDLLVMGEVAKAEYVFWAHYIKKYGRYPIFNDKDISPKPCFIKAN